MHIAAIYAACVPSLVIENITKNSNNLKVCSPTSLIQLSKCCFRPQRAPLKAEYKLPAKTAGRSNSNILTLIGFVFFAIKFLKMTTNNVINNEQIVPIIRADDTAELSAL